MTRREPPATVTFEELAALSQKKERTSCGRQAFGLGKAKMAARARNKLSTLGKTWFAIPCFHGCGTSIFHLTTEVPNTGKTRRISGVEKRTRKKRRKRANRRMYEVMAITTWEDDGGAIHPQDIKDC